MDPVKQIPCPDVGRQHPCRKNDLRASTCARRRPSSSRAAWLGCGRHPVVAQSQGKLSSRPQRAPPVRVTARRDPDNPGNTEPPNADESSFPRERSPHPTGYRPGQGGGTTGSPSVREDSLRLPRKPARSAEAGLLQHGADSPQGPPRPPLCFETCNWTLEPGGPRRRGTKRAW